MARPVKEGLDYFELDCHMEEKVRLIQAEFGLKGFAIVVKLYQKIYGGFGYYCEWNEDSLLLFMSENGVSSRDEKNLISEIVAACIRRNIFSEKLFNEFGILTSYGVQKRYLNAVSRREKVELIKEYLLISVGKNQCNVCINSINVNRNSVNVCSNSQSREEKSREDNNIVATPAEPKPATVSFQDGSFEIRCVDMIINSCLKTFPNSKVPQSLTDSCWQTNIRSAKKFREKFETLIVQSRKNRNRGNIKNSFNNFTQNIYDFDELEKELLSN